MMEHTSVQKAQLRTKLVNLTNSSSRFLSPFFLDPIVRWQVSFSSSFVTFISIFIIRFIIRYFSSFNEVYESLRALDGQTFFCINFFDG